MIFHTKQGVVKTLWSHTEAYMQVTLGLRCTSGFITCFKHGPLSINTTVNNKVPTYFVSCKESYMRYVFLDYDNNNNTVLPLTATTEASIRNTSRCKGVIDVRSSHC